MAQINTAYDPDSDKKPSPHRTPEQDELHKFRQTLGMSPEEESELDEEALSGAVEDSKDEAEKSFFNSDGDSDKESSDDDEKEGEGGATAVAAGVAASESGLYNPDKDSQSGGKGKIRSSLKRLSKHKLLIGGVGGGVAIVALVIILLILFASSLELPDVMQNIEGYEFARVAQQLSDSTESVSDESLAVESVDDSTYTQLKAKFAGAYENIRDSTWGRLDAYRPSKVIQTLGDQNGLELRFKQSAIPGRDDIWTGGSYNGVDFDVEPVSGIANWIPGIRGIIQSKNAAISRNALLTAVNEDMEASGQYSTLIRGSVFLTLLKETDGSLAGIVLAKMTDDSDQGVQDEATQQMAEATQAGDTAPDNAATAEISDADKVEATTEEKDINDPTTLTAIVKNNGDDVAAETATNSVLDESLTSEIIHAISPVYSIVAPLCIIYDGSVQQSGPSIDDETHEQEDAFDQLAAESDQLKNGDMTPTDSTELANAARGITEQLGGDINDTIPMERAGGGGVDTSVIPGPEAGTDGSYNYSIFSIFNALGLPLSGVEEEVINIITSHLCSELTNGTVTISLAIVNLLLVGLSLGTVDAAETAAGASAREVVSEFVSNLASNLFEKLTAKIVVTDGVKSIETSALSRAMRFVFQQGLVVGGTVGATELAHLIVAYRAGEANYGTAQNSDLINEADSGANIEAGEVMRQQFFGRPLDSTETSDSEQQSTQIIADDNASKSFTDRYFSLANADSLLTHVAFDLSANLNRGMFASIVNLATDIMHPESLFGSIVNSLGLVAHAAPDPNTEDYGNVQFGWTPDEQNLVETNSSYAPLENQQILDNYGSETAIASKYAPCFGYQYNAGGNGDIDPTDPNGDLEPAAYAGGTGSLGTLFSQGEITRDDTTGDVTNAGLCSPTNLSYDSPDSLAVDSAPGTPKPDDMIFRWRLAMEYDTTLDQLISEQSVTTASAAQ